MSLAMKRRLRNASPLGYASDGNISTSSNDLPPPKERTETFRTLTRTPPTRYSTLGPESTTHLAPAVSHLDSTNRDDDDEQLKSTAVVNTSFAHSSSCSDTEVEPDNADNDTGGAGDEEEDENAFAGIPAHRPDTAPLPTLSELGATLSTSSIISSHDTSFCNSLIVSQAERLPSMDPRHMITTVPTTATTTTTTATTAHRCASSGCPAMATACAAVTHGALDGGLAGAGAGGGVRDEVSENGDTIASSGDAPGIEGHDELHIEHPGHAASVREEKKVSFSKTDDETLSAHSPTSLGSSRLRHHPVSPAGDVRTLRDLMAWRSHLSDSQRSLDDHHPPQHSSGGGSPFSKSVPTPPPSAMHGVADPPTTAAAAAAAFPASTPVTPGLWTPAPIPRTHLHAPPSLPSLFDQTAKSPLSATAAPVSRHPSRDDVASRASAAASLASTGVASHYEDYPHSHNHHGQQQQQSHGAPDHNSNSNTNNRISGSMGSGDGGGGGGAGQLPPRLASNRFSRSDFGDSLPSSTSTSHITSPAVGLPPHHQISSPYDSRPPIETNHGGYGNFSDHRHSDPNNQNDHHNNYNSNDCKSTGRDTNYDETTGGVDARDVCVFPHSNVASPVLCSPLTTTPTTTTRGAVVYDTRRAAHSPADASPAQAHHLNPTHPSQSTTSSAGASSTGGNNNYTTNNISNNSRSGGCCGCHDTTSSAMPGGDGRDGFGPSPASCTSSRSPHGTWGIEDYAPPHPRSVGAHHLPLQTPTRHPLPGRASDACTSPRAQQHPLHPAQNSGSPLSLFSASRLGVNGVLGSGKSSPSPGSPGGTPAGPLPSYRGPHMAALSSPATKAWRGLQAPEEYPAFTTPVDDDTNKAVVAFVTALLLFFCLAFIFAM